MGRRHEPRRVLRSKLAWHEPRRVLRATNVKAHAPTGSEYNDDGNNDDDDDSKLVCHEPRRAGRVTWGVGTSQEGLCVRSLPGTSPAGFCAQRS
eukprot:7189998-Pyramimonas_sp.AAC.1